MTPRPCLCWLHIGDLHASDEDDWQSVDRLKAIVAEVREHVQAGAVDFAFLPGDNANHGEPCQYARIREALADLAAPLHVIPGDHDFEPGQLSAYREGLGAERLPAAVRVKGRRALFLDIVSAGSGGPDFRLGGEQTDWLKRELEEAKGDVDPPVVFMHAFPEDLHEGGPALARLFADAEVAMVDTGHTHYNDLLNDGAVIYAAVRSTGQVEEGPFGFAVAAVDGRAASFKFKAAGSPWPFVMITSPADARLATRATADGDTANLAVRAKTLGHDITEVLVQLGDGVPIAMAQVEGELGLWSAVAPRPADGEHRLRVVARTSKGTEGEDEIRLVLPAQATTGGPLGSADSSVGAWPEHGLLATRLGPNANGRDW